VAWPILACRDARALMTFLVEVFGFEPDQLIEDQGYVMLAWVRLPGTDQAVMLREAHPDLPAEAEYRAVLPTGPANIFVRSRDIEQIYQRAKDRGAHVVRPPKGPPGRRAMAVVDPEGNLWRFGNVLPAPPGPDAPRASTNQENR
jgi:uncharacterized glyoxalase superfamily protein PhnB